ncbi:carboxymuconolactone decarboxylase family protein [Emticicia sp. C21]|uniref:carboxymuconolactone decarboxylase family protein n=1 Tax=Emticicia sp. C21 TaxID=2302915 RepID=UPI000E3479E6|nr:peroxidase-related enzyme [Emticicia sp. C21]RFS15270.1 carboxymuconolactone decarboxylase family protein [Emticicia sp. C21]
MAYIKLPEEELLPGIRGLMAFRPDTARPLNALAEILLRDPNNNLSPGERETIATYVSYLNDCLFCQSVHGSAAQCYLEDDGTLIAQIKKNYEEAPISDKLKALLAIAASVQKGGKNVTTAQVEAARNAGATDKEIHDAVLIAAAFCMFNRYVDGLGTWAPTDPQAYAARGIRIKEDGYANFDAMKSIGK